MSVKAATPPISFSRDLNKLFLKGLKLSAEGRKCQFTFSDRYQSFASDMPVQENIFVLLVQGRAALTATCSAS